MRGLGYLTDAQLCEREWPLGIDHLTKEVLPPEFVEAVKREQAIPQEARDRINASYTRWAVVRGRKRLTVEYSAWTKPIFGGNIKKPQDSGVRCTYPMHYRAAPSM